MSHLRRGHLPRNRLGAHMRSNSIPSIKLLPLRASTQYLVSSWGPYVDELDAKYRVGSIVLGSVWKRPYNLGMLTWSQSTRASWRSLLMAVVAVLLMLRDGCYCLFSPLLLCSDALVCVSRFVLWRSRLSRCDLSHIDALSLMIGTRYALCVRRQKTMLLLYIGHRYICEYG